MDSDERAAGEASPEILLANRHALITVTRVSDEHRHRYDVVHRAAHQCHGLPQSLEDLVGLGREVAGQGVGAPIPAR